MKSILMMFLALILASCVSKEKVSETRQPSSESIPKFSMTLKDHSFLIENFEIPLHNSEKIPDDEPAAIDSLNEIMLGFFKKQYMDGGPTKDPATGMLFKGTRRGVHPRSHGCYQGKLDVEKRLDGDVGIFKRGASYDVTIRFSNGSPQISGDDRSVDTRGFAMKVHQVPGEHLLGDYAMVTNEPMSQDFTLNSTEPFFADNASRYKDFMQILSFESKGLEDAAKKFIFHLIKTGHPIIATRVGKAFLKIQNLKVSNPLGISYYSITPFQLGKGPDADVVKYKVAPCQGEWQEAIDAKDPFFLRNNLKKYLSQKEACFNMMVQYRTEESQTVEDPTRSWEESKVPFVKLATIRIPVQQAMEEMACEKMVINPWNTIPEHKPLGGINRIRLPTYLMSVAKRKQTNGY